MDGWMDGWIDGWMDGWGVAKIDSDPGILDRWARWKTGLTMPMRC